MKKPGIIRYILISVIIFLIAVFVAIITRSLLVNEFKLFSFNDVQASIITGTIEAAVAAVAAGFVLYEMKINGNVNEHENDIEEAQFLLQYNQAFIQDENMVFVENMLEKWMTKESARDEKLINDENRQQFINYLVYLEGLAPLIFRGILKLEHIDDLMAYRFFLAMNNPEVQKDQIYPFADYYLGCIKLYNLWKEYRIKKGLPILMEEYSLDNWSQYKYYLSDVNVRKCCSDDDLEEVSALIYDTDPYIYPAAFGTRNRAKQLMPDIMKNNTVFSIDNTIVAIKNEEIVGIAVIISNSNKTIDEIVPNDKYVRTFSDVNDNYFKKIPSYVNDKEIYVACVCVRRENRSQGVGQSLLNYIVNKYGDYTLKLDVLKNNETAIKLYERFGFEIAGTHQGYSSSKLKPECIQMFRKENESEIKLSHLCQKLMLF